MCGRSDKAMFFEKKKKIVRKTFDKEKMYPMILSSICTGERVAGFRRRDDGKFLDIMFLRNDEDLEEFLETYGLREDEVKVEY